MDERELPPRFIVSNTIQVESSLISKINAFMDFLIRRNVLRLLTEKQQEQFSELHMEIRDAIRKHKTFWDYSLDFIVALHLAKKISVKALAENLGWSEDQVVYMAKLLGTYHKITISQGMVSYGQEDG